MFPFEILAERRILEAMERGDFDRLPGSGKPLRLEDDSLVPGDLRIVYKVLKNAGVLPPELELRKEILTLRDLLRTVEDDAERRRRTREMNRKLIHLELLRGRPANLDPFPEYRERVLEKLGG
jgi:DnaJ homologue, subfamily C, member 28, conserved domain